MDMITGGFAVMGLLMLAGILVELSAIAKAATIFAFVLEEARRTRMSR